jgi:hypothetical protein
LLGGFNVLEVKMAECVFPISFNILVDEDVDIMVKLEFVFVKIDDYSR